MNGKGDKDRVRNLKGFNSGHKGVYGYREKVDGRRTKLVVRGNMVVRHQTAPDDLESQRASSLE